MGEVPLQLQPVRSSGPVKLVHVPFVMGSWLGLVTVVPGWLLAWVLLSSLPRGA